MVNILAVGIGGFIGASGRYLMGKIPMHGIMDFPMNTFAINVIGALVIGIVAAVATGHNLDSSRAILLLKTGLCGGFTTFSTFSLETLSLIQDGKIIMAGGYAVASVVICLASVWAGTMIGEHI